MATPRDYYNEIDPFAAAWLRELIAAGEIPTGDVDERSIEDVVPIDLTGYRHCHFFAGIGGWAYAMRLAEWPDDEPLWTGSAPCQPFSAAGKGGGFTDERHLWPAFAWLIAQCQPRALAGEQVASADALRWWDLVATDLEGAGYACTAVDLPAASVGAPHKRQRLFWVADATTERHYGRRAGHARDESSAVERLERLRDAGGQLGNSAGIRREVALQHTGGRTASSTEREADVVGGGSVASYFMGDTNIQRLEGRAVSGERARECVTREASMGSAWADCDWLPCTDGKARPVESGTFPLAHRAPARVGRLRGYGNGFVPQVGAEVLRAWREVMTC